MHAVCQTHAFTRAAQRAGMTQEEIDSLIDFLSENPDAGDEIAGTGGCRKLRTAGRGHGKSGGFRTITFYSGAALPVFLITVFAKGDKTNLTQAERNGLRAITKDLVAVYQTKVQKVAGS